MTTDTRAASVKYHAELLRSPPDAGGIAEDAADLLEAVARERDEALASLREALASQPRQATPVVSHDPASGDTQDPAPAVVDHPERETPAPKSAPAGAGVPDGKADIVDRLLAGTVMGAVRWPGDNSPPVDEYRTDVLMAEAADEIACLRAEVERLTEFAAFKRSEVAAVRGTVERLQADRAALAKRVAEAVREALILSVRSAEWARGHRITQAEWETLRDHLRALDLGRIVVAALAKEGK
jgi:hypothetical protein